MNKKRIQVQVIDREFEDQVKRFADDQLEKEKEYYHSNLESWNLYSERKKQRVADETINFSKSFLRGYQSLIDYIQKG